MKSYLFTAIAFFAILETSSAQGNLPPTYYSTITNQTCGPLKTALYNIISKNTTVISYDGLWTTYLKTDARRNDANTATIVWDMYSDNPAGAEPYTFTFITNQCGTYNSEGDCYNREHSFPQSWFSENSPMVSDIHHIFPTDGSVNGRRGNYPYGEVGTATWTSLNGSKLGSSVTGSGYTGTVFEPINEYKGDFARAQLYMSVRYDNLIAGWQSNANEVLDGTQYPSFDAWYIKMMYKWHVQDPVSDKERKRNDSIFVYQKNRNPFVDHPEWVYTIWSCTGYITATGVNDVDHVAVRGVTIYPNPVTNHVISVRLEKAFMQQVQLQIIDLTGRILKQQQLPSGQMSATIPVYELNSGMYILKIQTRDGIITKPVIIQ